MDKEIKELKAAFFKKLSDKYNIFDCEVFAKIAVSEGYKQKKCFNIEHKVFSGGRDL